MSVTGAVPNRDGHLPSGSQLREPVRLGWEVRAEGPGVAAVLILPKGWGCVVAGGWWRVGTSSGGHELKACVSSHVIRV